MDGRGVYFLFGSVFIKKNNQTKFFLKKNRNRTETGSNQPVSVRFGFLEQKPVQTGLTQFSRFWLDFFPVFSGSGSVRFGFFGSKLKKPEPNRTGRFFQNFNRFFFTVRFFWLFFFGFLSLIDFSVFLNTSNQGCQFRFGRCFVFTIGMECFSFGVFRRAVSGLYCSYIYIYIQQT